MNTINWDQEGEGERRLSQQSALRFAAWSDKECYQEPFLVT